MADVSADAFATSGADELAAFIIRPPRVQYSRHDLGDRTFTAEGAPATREDLVLRNSRGFQLQASHFRPLRAAPGHPTVVYLHGNGSCRVEATILLPLTIPYGVSVFAFDFSGSGRSEGEFCSLGLWERLDVQAAVDHLVKLDVRTIILWGYSMGAAAAILYAGKCSCHPAVKTLILDSPFSSFDKLAQAVVSDMVIPKGIPRKLILSIGVRVVRKTVRERAQFDVFDIDPLSALRTFPPNIPALFIHGSADTMVPPSHGESLFQAYPCPEKSWVCIPNLDHDSPRPDSSMDQAFFYIMRAVHDTSSITYLEALKSRGNTAMLSARFADAIFLYSQALLALRRVLPEPESNQQIESKTASGRIALAGRRDRKSTTASKLSRRNSSVPSIVTSVKRWRNRTAVATSSTASPTSTTNANGVKETLPSTPPSISTPTVVSPTDDDEDNQIPSHPVQTSTTLMDWDRTQQPSWDVEETFGASGSGSPTPDDSEQVSPPNVDAVVRDIDNSNNDVDEDDRRSEASLRTARCARQKSWCTRNVMERFRRRIRVRTGKNTQKMGDCDEDVSGKSEPKGSGNTFVVNELKTATGGSANEKGLSESVPDKKPAEVRKGDTGGKSGCGVNIRAWMSMGNACWEPRRSSRSSKSTSRVKLRYHGRRERARRGSSQVEDDWENGFGSLTNVGIDRKDDVKGAPKPADKRSVQTSRSAGPMGEDGDGLGDVSQWVVNEERRALALALLGNRSLARRKVKDNIGALHDASRCLQLDHKWVRGYLRKAAALKEEGQLLQAKEVVEQGLSYEPYHAGLLDLLDSLEEALSSGD